LDKKRGENKELEQFAEPSEVKTARERFPESCSKTKVFYKRIIFLIDVY